MQVPGATSMPKPRLTWLVVIFSTLSLLSVIKILLLDDWLTEWQFQADINPLSSNRSLVFQPQKAFHFGRLEVDPCSDGFAKEGRGSCNISSHASGISVSHEKKTRVLIWVMTMPKNLHTKAKAVLETWGKRCDVLIFFSSKSDTSFPVVELDVPEGRHHLTAKTMAAFRYIYEHHFDDADWFMKADDDTYVVMENLRHFLSDKDPNTPLYYGYLLRGTSRRWYNSGGAGYVISKEAFRRFGTQAVRSNLCPEDGNDEDVDFGECMEKLDVPASPSLDTNGGTLFHALQPKVHVLGQYPSWLKRYEAHMPIKGASKNAVSFHYTLPEDMYMLEYYLYSLTPYEKTVERTPT